MGWEDKGNDERDEAGNMVSHFTFTWIINTCRRKSSRQKAWSWWSFTPLGAGTGTSLIILVNLLIVCLLTSPSSPPSFPPSLPPSLLPSDSKNLVPEWDKAATALKGVVTVAAVDASVVQSLAQKYDVKVRKREEMR